jgi:hypothetical protein
MLLDQTEIMRFNNNRNFEKFQENIKSKKGGSSMALDEGHTSHPPAVLDTSQVSISKVRYQTVNQSYSKKPRNLGLREYQTQHEPNPDLILQESAQVDIQSEADASPSHHDYV